MKSQQAYQKQERNHIVDLKRLFIDVFPHHFDLVFEQKCS